MDMAAAMYGQLMLPATVTQVDGEAFNSCNGTWRQVPARSTKYPLLNNDWEALTSFARSHRLRLRDPAGIDRSRTAPQQEKASR